MFLICRAGHTRPLLRQSNTAYRPTGYYHSIWCQNSILSPKGDHFTYCILSQKPKCVVAVVACVHKTGDSLGLSYIYIYAQSVLGAEYGDNDITLALFSLPASLSAGSVRSRASPKQATQAEKPNRMQYES